LNHGVDRFLLAGGFFIPERGKRVNPEPPKPLKGYWRATRKLSGPSGEGLQRGDWEFG
jgi:hypothetical protein